MQRILFLTQGDLQVPSSRYRVYQYLPALEKAGFEVVVHPAVKAEEFHGAYMERSWKNQFPRFGRTFARRVRDLHHLRDFQFVFVQKPIFPSPFFNIEWRIARETKMIFDFDDAIYLKRPRGAFLSGIWPQAQRVANICRRAYRVVVGNQTLAEFVRKIPGSTIEPITLPTAVDTEIYTRESDISKRPNRIPLIGWIGTPSTQSDLDLIIPSLIDLHSKTAFDTWIIGGILASIPVRFPIQWKTWNLKTEIRDVANLDIGVAPMKETPWNHGKCGLKVLQYWAAGVPVIASPVGIYKEMIQDGENGFFASNRAEWTDRLLLLMKNKQIRHKVIEGGHQTVQEKYSLQTITSRFLNLFS